MVLNFIKYIGFFIVITSFGCVATAKLTDLPNSSTTIDFDKYSKELKSNKTPFWTYKSSNEYYFEKASQISEDKLIGLISQALIKKRYRIEITDKKNRRIIGRRGMRANEWNSITGVYYNFSNNKTQIYIQTRITQDITGGWTENRAKEIGDLMESSMDSNNTKENPSVNN